MGILRSFRYRAPLSMLHAVDPRCKLLCLIILQMATIYLPPTLLLPLPILMAVAYRLGRMSLWIELANLRLFLGMALFIVLTRALATPGHSIVTLGAITVTAEGLLDGGLLGVRLIGAALIANLYVGVTPAGDIVDTLHWLLAPINQSLAGRVSLMCGLSLSFYPLLCRELITRREALALRGLHAKRHPMTTMRTLAHATLLAIPRRCDLVTEALKTRCYSDVRTPPRFRGSAGRRAMDSVK